MIPLDEYVTPYIREEVNYGGLKNNSLKKLFYKSEFENIFIKTFEYAQEIIDKENKKRVKS